MRPFNITFRLGAVFCLLVAILFAVGWQGISHLRRLDAQLQNIVCDRWAKQQLSHQAFQLSAQNSQITMQIFLMDDAKAIQELLVQRAANVQRVTELVGIIEPRLDTEKEKQLLAAVKAARTLYIESYLRALALLLTEQKRDEAAKMMVNDVRPRLFTYQNAWGAFDQYEANEINQVMEQGKSTFAAGQRDLLFLLAIAGLITVGIAVSVIGILKREMVVRQRAETYLEESRALEARLGERASQLARTNETLAATSALLEALLANTADHIYFKDLQSRFVHFSLEMLKHFRLAHPDELKGRTDFDFFTGEHARPAFEAEQEIIRTGRPMLNLEEKITHIDGRLGWVLTSKMPWRDLAGNIIGTMGISRDITQRKQAAEILQESEARFAGAFEHAPVGMALVGIDGRWLKVNRALCDMTGYAEAELLARTYQDITHPGDLAGCVEHVRQLFAGEIRFCQSEKRYVHANGNPLPVTFNLSLVRDGQGRPLYLIAQIQDITARRAAEVVLKELSERTERRERMLTTTFTALNDFAYIFDHDGRFLFANQPLLNLWGIPLEAAVGKNFAELGYPEDLARKLQTQVQQVFDTRQNVTDETSYTSPTGVSGCYEYIFSPAVGADGTVDFVVGCTRDITARKQAEEKLRERKERLRAALAASGTGTFRWDIRTSELNWDESLDALFGLSPGQTVRSLETFIGVIHPGDRPGVIERCERCAREGSDFDMAFRVLWPDGSVHWLDDKGKTFFDAAGQPLYMTGACVDITERKQAETMLLDSKRFLQSTLDALSAHIAILDEHGTIVEVNAAWNRFAIANGSEDGRNVGTNYLKVCDAAAANCSTEAPVVADGIRAVMAGRREEFLWEYSCPSPQELNWFMLRVTRFLGDGPVRVVVAHENITEQKRAEAALRESQQRLALATKSARVGIWDWDVVANKMFWDAQMYELYGIREQDFSGAYDAWQKGLHPDDRERSEAEIAAALESRKDFHAEFRVMRSGGEVRHIEAHGMVVQADDGSAARMIGVNWDITERKKLEMQLIQSQKMETVGKLAGGIAHQFNSILTAIMGQSELLLGDLPAGSPLVQNATEIGRAAARAATLTRQLLAYGRKQLLQPEALDLNRVITNLEGVLKHLLGADMDVRIIPVLDLPPVKADAGQIEQVIMNLVINARDAMPNGGKLTLETAKVTLDEEYVSRFPAFEVKAGEYVMLAITDTGTGMSEAIKVRLFEPFFTTKIVGQGTGLGLPTCYGIIKQSGGHISVYSELGRGTTFKIYLPQMAAPTKSPARPLDPQNLLHGTETILLVEDDPALRTMAATLLKRLGYTVLTAGDGVEALNRLQEPRAGRIDLLFTDVVMPQMSGRELAERVRALYPGTKILFNSAYTENAIVHQSALDKGVALLQKPFTPSALAKKIREVLGPADAPKPDAAAETPGARAARITENTP